jgi:hypothetical protein
VTLFWGIFLGQQPISQRTDTSFLLFFFIPSLSYTWHPPSSPTFLFCFSFDFLTWAGCSTLVRVGGGGSCSGRLWHCTFEMQLRFSSYFLQWRNNTRRNKKERKMVGTEAKAEAGSFIICWCCCFVSFSWSCSLFFFPFALPLVLTHTRETAELRERATRVDNFLWDYCALCGMGSSPVWAVSLSPLARKHPK